MRTISSAVVAILFSALASGPAAQAPRPRDEANGAVTILKPARVFDGDAMHEGWAVRVKGDRIDLAGPDAAAPPGAKTIDLPGTTLMPGLVEGHSHILLHAYSETSWTDQVSREGLALRVARALLQLWDDAKFTLLFVTHSIPEALRIGSRILLLSAHPGQVKAEINSQGTDAARLEQLLFGEAGGADA